MKPKIPYSLRAEALRQKSYNDLEQQIALTPLLAIPVMFNHVSADRPFDALRVLVQVGENIGTPKGLSKSMLGDVLSDVFPCARTHQRWREKLRETFSILPHASLKFLRETLPGSANADLFELLPPRSEAQRKEMH